MGKRAIDLTGRRFGKLYVKRLSTPEEAAQHTKANTTKSGRYWKCECDCGNVTELRTDLLVRRGRTDCGCKNVIDLVGKRFGNLVVIKMESVGRRSVRHWRCKCDCGKVRSDLVTTKSLQNSRFTSCGCMANPSGNSHPCFRGVGEITGTYWTRTERGANLRGLAVEISIDEAWELFERQRHKCAYTGWTLTFGSRQDSKNTTASLDRIDSSKGYVSGNVQWVHKTVNMMKRDMSDQQFVNTCNAIAEYNLKGKNEI